MSLCFQLWPAQPWLLQALSQQMGLVLCLPATSINHSINHSINQSKSVQLEFLCSLLMNLSVKMLQKTHEKLKLRDVYFGEEIF